MNGFIYALGEEGLEEVRYVGQTLCLIGRKDDHLNSRGVKCLNDENPRKIWFSDVSSRGATMSFVALEECGIEVLAERENFWIDHFRRLGHRLTNTQPGGRSPAVTRILRRKKEEQERALMSPEERDWWDICRTREMIDGD